MSKSATGGSSLAHPVMLFGLLSASRRFDAAIYRNVCDEFGISTEGVERLAAEGVLLGNLPLKLALRRLSESPHYPAMAELAGRESYHFLSGSSSAPHGLNPALLTPSRFDHAVKSAMKTISGLDTAIRISLLRKRNSYFLELKNSPFAIGNAAIPQCGFITGFFKCALTEICGRESAVEELRCAGCDSSGQICVFAIPEP